MIVEFYTAPALPTAVIVRVDDDWFAVPNTITTPTVAWSQRRKMPPQHPDRINRMMDGSLFARMMLPVIALPMTPAAIKAARDTLGLSVADLAKLLDTDPQTVRRMEQREDASTFRKPAPRMERLIRAYLSGYRPEDWPGSA